MGGNIEVLQIEDAIKQVKNIYNGDDIIEGIKNDLNTIYSMDQEQILKDEQVHEIQCWGFVVVTHSCEKDIVNLEHQVKDFEMNYEHSMDNKIQILRDTVVPERISLEIFCNKESVNYVKRYFGNIDFFMFNYDNEANEDLIDHFKQYLQNNGGSGFMIRNYNLMIYLEFIYMKQFVKDSHFLKFESSHVMDHIGVMEKSRAIFFIKVSSAKTFQELMHDIRDSAAYIRMFIMLHRKHLLDKISSLISFIIIPTESKHLIDELNNVCSSCGTYVITEEAFRKVDLEFEGVLEKIEDAIDSETWEKLLSYDFCNFKYNLASIFGFMASQNSVYIPGLTKNVVKQIDNVKILFNPKQLEIANSKDKRVLLIGSYGSGKTLVARSHLKKSMTIADQNVFAHYVNFSSSIDLTEDMRTFVEGLNNKAILCTEVDGAEDGSKLVNTMNHIKQNHDENAKIHLIFDEVALNNFSEVELMDFIRTFKEPWFVDTHCMIVCQAMSNKRSYTQDGVDFIHSFTGQVELLTKKGGFKVKKLDVNFRNTLRVADLAQHTKDILQNCNNRFNISSVQEDYNVNLQTSSNENDFKVSKLSPIQSFNFGLNTRSLAQSELPMKNFENLDLQLKVFKQNQSSNNDEKSYLESRYTYCHDNTAAMHKIEGPYPMLYFPFDIKLEYTDLEKLYLVCLCFKNLHDLKIIKRKDSVTVIHFEKQTPNALENMLIALQKYYKISFDNMTFKYFSETKGYEYDNVVIFISTAEYHMRHYLVEAITRSKNNLIFIVVKEDWEHSKGDIIWKIIEEWIGRNLVKCKYQNDLQYDSKMLEKMEPIFRDGFFWCSLEEHSLNIDSIYRYIASLRNSQEIVEDPTNESEKTVYRSNANDIVVGEYLENQKNWQSSVSSAQRNHLIDCIVSAINNMNPELENSKKFIPYATFVEGDIYSVAESKEDYFHRLAELVYKIHSKMIDPTDWFRENRDSPPALVTDQSNLQASEGEKLGKKIAYLQREYETLQDELLFFKSQLEDYRKHEAEQQQTYRKRQITLRKKRLNQVIKEIEELKGTEMLLAIDEVSV